MNDMIYVSKKYKIEFSVCVNNHIWVYIALSKLNEMGNVLPIINYRRIYENFYV